jgi:hypothetical protein
MTSSGALYGDHDADHKASLVGTPLRCFQRRLPLLFIGTSISQKKPHPIFHVFSVATVQAKVLEQILLLCNRQRGKSAPSSPPTLSKRREVTSSTSAYITIIITATISEIYIIPLTVCVDWSPRTTLLNLILICAWVIDIVLW